VIARNKVGESLPSGHSKTCLTPEDVPFKNPDNVEGRGTAPSNLVIYWTVRIDHYSLHSWLNHRQKVPFIWEFRDILDFLLSRFNQATVHWNDKLVHLPCAFSLAYA
jgi:neuronal cell adhesion protein